MADAFDLVGYGPQASTVDMLSKKQQKKLAKQQKKADKKAAKEAFKDLKDAVGGTVADLGSALASFSASPPTSSPQPPGEEPATGEGFPWVKLALIGAAVYLAYRYFKSRKR